MRRRKGREDTAFVTGLEIVWEGINKSYGGGSLTLSLIKEQS